MINKTVPWLSVSHVADRLGVTRWSIYRYLESGALRKVWFTEVQWGITAVSVEEYEMRLERLNQAEMCVYD